MEIKLNKAKIIDIFDTTAQGVCLAIALYMGIAISYHIVINKLSGADLYALLVFIPCLFALVYRNLYVLFRQIAVEQNESLKEAKNLLNESEVLIEKGAKMVSSYESVITREITRRKSFERTIN